MSAPLRERLEATEAQTDSLLKLFRDADWQEDCTLIMGLVNIRGGIREALAALDEREKDAERYRCLQLRMRGERFASGRQYFDVDFPDPLTNIMQGSVAEHFNDAIDATIKEGKCAA